MEGQEHRGFGIAQIDFESSARQCYPGPKTYKLNYRDISMSAKN